MADYWSPAFHCIPSCLHVSSVEKLACSRLKEIVGYANLRKREYENKMGGYRGEERLRNLYHFLKRPVPVYQLLVYPLIGQFCQLIARAIISHL